MKMSREELARRFAEADDVVCHLARRRRERVTIDPMHMDGAPCVCGVPVSDVVRMVSQEYSVETICKAVPGMTREDVSAAVEFAADNLVERYWSGSGRR